MSLPPRRSSRITRGIPPRRLIFNPEPSRIPRLSLQANARNMTENGEPSSLGNLRDANASNSQDSSTELTRVLSEMRIQMAELERRCAESESGLQAERTKRMELERQLLNGNSANGTSTGTMNLSLFPNVNPDGTPVNTTQQNINPGTPVTTFVNPDGPPVISSLPNMNQGGPPPVSLFESHTNPKEKPPGQPSFSSVQWQNPFNVQRKLYDLPCFSGKPEQWPAFYAAFQQSTEVYRYSDLENLFRLQKCLSNEARDSVECLLIDPRHVKDVLLALESRFGRPELLVNSQLHKVREIPPIAEHNLAMIVPFATKVQNFATFLDMPNTQQHLANPILLNELVDKLPLGKRIEWAQYASAIRPYPTLKDLSIWVNNIAQFVQIATASSSSMEPSTSQSRKEKPAKTNNNGRRVLLNSHEPATKPSEQPSCSYCAEGGHSTAECREFKKLSVDQRWREVKCRHILCRRKKRCGVDGCKWTHHSLLHESDPATKINDTEKPPRTNPFAKPSEAVPSPQPGPSKPVLNCVRMPDEPELLFRIVPVTLFGDNKEVATYALLDEGSSVSLIDEAIATELQLKGPTSTLQLTWFGDKSSSEPSKCVDLDICGRDPGQKRYPLRAVRTIRNISLPTQTIDMNSLHSRYRHLKKLPIANMEQAEPKILLGLDHCHLGIAQEMFDDAVGTPIAAKTKLGWVVYGPMGRNSTTRPHVVLHGRVTKPSLNDLDRVISDYFSTENFGVSPSNTTLESKDDARALEILRATTVRVSPTMYQTGLLWKEDDPWLPDSLTMALNRLKSIERKMARDPTFAKEYANAIVAFVEKGYARKLSPEESRQQNKRKWYLPHFAVKNINKPGKIRVVFDAAAEVNGTSLNSALLKGPDLNQSLQKILFQFRVSSIGVCGDIREMFLQVRIQPNDQVAQRFLWRHGNEKNELEEYSMNSMTFGSTCSPCCAQFVKNTNAEQFVDRHPEAVAAILANHYVDDYVISFDSPAQAIRVTKDVIDIHRKAGFELRNFSSNCRDVLDAIGSVELQPQPLSMQLDPDVQSEKILGMFWCTSTDCFMFMLKFNRVPPEIVSHNRHPTKRQVLSLAMSIFDPFGILANFTLYSKLLFQEICQSNIGWDEPIPMPTFLKWSQWLDELPKVRDCRVPRCYSVHFTESDDVQLHIFADASEVAFAAVAYWRVVCPDRRIEIAFVAGKTKCAPVKLLSIPRLELQAAVLATRLLNCIIASHRMNISRIYLWTDSKTVVQWIRSDSRQYKPFVAHRIAEILDTTHEDQWNWLPTKENVADDATRAKYPPMYDASSRWLSGPSFLSGDIETWPKLEVTTNNSNEELKRRFVNLGVIGKPLITITNHSCFARLRRIAAWVLRFVANTISVKVTGSTIRRGELTVDECERGENLLCRIAQAECFAEEIAVCESNQPVSKSSSIYQLTPGLNDDNLLCVQGRIDAANAIPLFTRRPIILPRNHALTELIVAFHHRKMKHQHEGAVICSIRDRFWIPNVRSLVRSAAKNCMVCRLRNAVPRVPIMGQLPEDRLTPYVRPFTFTGLDYFGPLFVTVGRRREKRWVALFTCLTIRAVHLELASDLSTDACIMCLTNFINIRGVPKRIRSDNGTNFVGASREWENAVHNLDQNAIRSTLTSHGVEWIFNCPANPSAGGCWERLVQSVKRVLAITLKETAPRVETLRCLLIESANIVNSRPLTHVPISSDEDDPLTPNDFLLGTNNANCNLTEENARLLCHRKQWRVLQQLTTMFWKRWIREYLPDLTRRTKWFADVEPLKIGDLVLICDESQSRNKWRRGRVTETHVGPDGKIRTAKISTCDGVVSRPSSKLARLDVKQ